MSEQKSVQETVFSKQAVLDLADKNADRTYISIHENVFDVTQFLDEVSSAHSFAPSGFVF